LALINCGLRQQEVDELMRLLAVVDLPPLERFHDLDHVVSSMEVDEVVHCAGCVDYFDKRRLQLANVELTSKLLESARRWSAQRFFYLSTAYCAGYRSETIPERLHPDPAPADEPTDYTRSKRMAEWCVADSGIPFVIIRPSIVIGDSRTGIYTGKNYGLYQMWRAIEGLLCREYSPVWHTVAPRVPLNFVHQDAFQNGFMDIYRSVAPSAIVHLVADHAKSPTMRELCWLWADVYCPTEIHCYARVDDVPLYSIPMRQRRFLELAAKNFEIATHTWIFETQYLNRFRAAGLPFADATLETVAVCQNRYIEGSTRIQEHMRRYAGQTGKRPCLVEMFSS
jgi:dTDP-4-dehydrorhamnose reductase